MPCINILKLARSIASQIEGNHKAAAHEVFPPMTTGDKKGFIRAFFDFFVLFSGISTASNLARTQGRPLLTRGLFLFRKSAPK